MYEELNVLSTAELMEGIEAEYRRATWESPENFSDQPNHPHVRLGRLLEELKRRMSAPTEY